MFKSIKIEMYTARLGLGSSEVKIWAEDGKLHYCKNIFDGEIKGSDFNNPSNNGEDLISTVSLEEFSSKIEKLDIKGWDKEYMDYCVLDGVSWDLKYETDNGKPIKVGGSNAYPREWKKLIRLIRSVVGDTGILK